MHAGFPLPAFRHTAGAGSVAVPALRSRQCLRPGMCLHLGDAVESEDQVGHDVATDGVRMVLVLTGAVELRWGDDRFRLTGDGATDAAMVTAGTPLDCSRIARRGDHARRISISLARDWIEQAIDPDAGLQGLEALWQPRAVVRHWRASALARSLAEQILAPPSLMPSLLRLYRESRVIDLVVGALSQVPASRRSEPAALPAATHRRMCELREFLEQRRSRDAELSIAQIARMAGISTTTLQRQFRRAHGLTVSDVLQHGRLSRARHALEREGASVGRAAYLAGYTDPANFATAFKRRYGVAPSQLRAGARASGTAPRTAAASAQAGAAGAQAGPTYA